MPPDRHGDVGERVNARSPRRREQALWQLDSRLPRVRPLADHVRDVLDRLPAALPPADVDAEWFCLLIGEEEVAADLDAALLAALARFPAWFVVDVYPPGEHGEAPDKRAGAVAGGVRSALPAAAPPGSHVADVLDRGGAAAGLVECWYTSANGQGSVEFDAALVRRLAGSGVTLRLRLVPWPPGFDPGGGGVVP